MSMRVLMLHPYTKFKVRKISLIFGHYIYPSGNIELLIKTAAIDYFCGRLCGRLFRRLVDEILLDIYSGL